MVKNRTNNNNSVTNSNNNMANNNYININKAINDDK